MTTRAQVVVWTVGLSLLVLVMAIGVVAAQYWLWGIESADLRTMAGMTVLTCTLLAPGFMAPLVWFVLRHLELTARLRELALTDELTGVPNRRAFFQNLDRRLGPRGEPMPFAVLMIDVDRFKALNDRLGHQAGDAALAFVAARLNHSLRRLRIEDVLLARLGGEEFAAFLPYANAATAARVAEVICADMRAAEFRHRGGAVALTVSVGVWAGPFEEGAEAALAAADRAVYAAKARGRDRWEVAGERAGDWAGHPATAEVRRLAG